MAPTSPTEAEREATITKALLALAVVYWTPSFTPAQAEARLDQYLTDLQPYPLADVLDAIAAYRRSPKPFYPSPGQIIELIAPYEPPSDDEDFRNRLRAWRAACEANPAVAPEECWPRAWGGIGPGTDPRHPETVLAEMGIGQRRIANKSSAAVATSEHGRYDTSRDACHAKKPEDVTP